MQLSIIKQEIEDLEKLINKFSIKIFALFLSLNMFSQNLSFDKGEVYTLDEISVTGLKSFNEQTVITYTGLSKGKQIRIPGEEISQVINKLWKLEFELNHLYNLTSTIVGHLVIANGPDGVVRIFLVGQPCGECGCGKLEQKLQSDDLIVTTQ